MKAHIVIRGVDDLDDAFKRLRAGILDETQPGFLPLVRYRGAGGVPFVSDTVELVARRLGFETSGGIDV